MQQIADWLKELGLPEYAERFAENGIDVSVLPHLSDQDLKGPTWSSTQDPCGNWPVEQSFSLGSRSQPGADADRRGNGALDWPAN
jgi:hypothetical protein